MQYKAYFIVKLVMFYYLSNEYFQIMACVY